jgi:3D (Asp-Asp-Asp) domain-containing protein
VRRLFAAALLLLSHSTPVHAQALEDTVQARVTAYCLTGTTRTGGPTRLGVVAVDPNVIPLYSTVSIEGMGLFTALDTGGGVKGNHVDMWMASCSDALQWGVREREVSWWP